MVDTYFTKYSALNGTSQRRQFIIDATLFQFQFFGTCHGFGIDIAEAVGYLYV